MARKLEIGVEKVNGHCIYGYKVGDVIPLSGFDTPAGFCSGAYITLFPIVVARRGAVRVREGPALQDEDGLPGQ